MWSFHLEEQENSSDIGGQVQQPVKLVVIKMMMMKMMVITTMMKMVMKMMLILMMIMMMMLLIVMMMTLISIMNSMKVIKITKMRYIHNTRKLSLKMMINMLTIKIIEIRGQCQELGEIITVFHNMGSNDFLIV